MDTRVETVLSAVRNGRVDKEIIALAGQLIDDGVVEEEYQWVIGCVAAANGDPSPKMRQGVNEILQTALDFSEGKMDSVSRDS